MNVSPGWYPHPNNPQALMYWDGRIWRTDMVQRPVAMSTPASPPLVVLAQPPHKRVNHALHLILSVFTLGLWLPVWLIVAIAKN